MKTRALIVLALAFLALPLAAITINQPERILVVQHGAGRVEIEDAGKAGTSRSLAESMSFTRRHDEVVRVAVDDPNPLIFVYTWKGVTKSDTEDYKAALAVTDSIRALAAGFKALAPVPEKPQDAQAGTEEALRVTKGDLQAFAKDLEQLSKWVDDIPALRERSAGSREAAQAVKVEVLAWHAEETIKDAERLMKDINDAGNRYFMDLNGTGKKVSNGDTSVGNTSGSTGTNPPAIAKKRQSPTLVKASDFNLTISFLLANAKGPELTTLINGLRSFVSNVRKINERLVFDPMEYSASQTVTGALDISGVKDVPEGEVSKRKHGTFNFGLDPYSPVSLRNLGAAVVYSFVETQDFDTKQGADGKFKIIRTDSGNAVNGVTLAAMLSLTPHSWSNPTVGGSFQLGVSPVKDRIGIFGGATLSLYDLFSIGGGIAFQQSERLAGGLHEGQNDLTSADQLKTTTKFKPGFYLSLTVKMK